MINRSFIDALSSKAATPGGGSASAYAGALSAALASMVANLTVGKKTYTNVEADMYICLEKLQNLTDELIELIDADARAFEPLAKSYRMPKNTPEDVALQDAFMQEALTNACVIPLEIMQTILEVLEQIDFVAENGSRLALSDAGAAAVFAKAAVQAASLNVFINTSSMKDKTRAHAYTQEADALIDAAENAADRIFNSISKTIR